jgi:hypothetical protein
MGNLRAVLDVRKVHADGSERREEAAGVHRLRGLYACGGMQVNHCAFSAAKVEDRAVGLYTGLRRHGILPPQPVARPSPLSALQKTWP